MHGVSKSVHSSTAHSLLHNRLHGVAPRLKGASQLEAPQSHHCAAVLLTTNPGDPCVQVAEDSGYESDTPLEALKREEPHFDKPDNDGDDDDDDDDLAHFGRVMGMQAVQQHKAELAAMRALSVNEPGF